MKIKDIKKKIDDAFGELAKELSKPKLGLEEMGIALVTVRETEKLCKEDGDNIKGQVVPILKEKGIDQKGSKTKLMTTGSVVWKMHPTASGLDPKKVATALLITKKDPAKCGMIEKKSYDLPIEGTRDDIKLRAMFTPEELKELEHEEKWTLKTPEEM